MDDVTRRAIRALSALLEQKTMSAGTYYSRDIADYKLFSCLHVERSTANLKERIYEMMNEFSAPCDEDDAYNYVPWPFPSMAVYHEEIDRTGGRSLFVSVPFFRKGSFFIACASVRFDGSQSYFYELVHSNGCDIFHVPDVYAFDANGYSYMPRSEVESRDDKDTCIGSRPMFAVLYTVKAAVSGGTCVGNIQPNPSNKKRVSKGKQPLFSWHTVEIKPRQRATQVECQHTGIKRRQHDVRGHYRHYKSGKTVFVKSHKKGDPRLGVIFKDYKV